MYRGLKYFLVFSVGAAAGATVAWKVLKTKYERIAQEEIDSVKEAFNRLEQGEPDSEQPAESKATTVEEDDEEYLVREEYYDMVSGLSYVQSDKKGGSDSVEEYRPKVITPEEFGDLDYEMVSLIFYADGVVTDDRNNMIEEVDYLIGLESLEHFGEYEDDTVFVRNDKLQTDYEVCLDTRSYFDLPKTVLNPTDGE